MVKTKKKLGNKENKDIFLVKKKRNEEIKKIKIVLFILSAIWLFYLNKEINVLKYWLMKYWCQSMQSVKRILAVVKN